MLYVFLSDPPFHLGPSMTIHEEAYDRWLQQTGHQAADDITVLVVDLTAREAKEPWGQTLAETQLVEYGTAILETNISIYQHISHISHFGKRNIICLKVPW